MPQASVPECQYGSDDNAVYLEESSNVKAVHHCAVQYRVDVFSSNRSVVLISSVILLFLFLLLLLLLFLFLLLALSSLSPCSLHQHSSTVLLCSVILNTEVAIIAYVLCITRN